MDVMPERWWRCRNDGGDVGTMVETPERWMRCRNDGGDAGTMDVMSERWMRCQSDGRDTETHRSYSEDTETTPKKRLRKQVVLWYDYKE